MAAKATTSGTTLSSASRLQSLPAVIQEAITIYLVGEVVARPPSITDCNNGIVAWRGASRRIANNMARATWKFDRTNLIALPTEHDMRALVASRRVCRSWRVMPSFLDVNLIAHRAALSIWPWASLPVKTKKKTKLPVSTTGALRMVDNDPLKKATSSSSSPAVSPAAAETKKVTKAIEKPIPVTWPMLYCSRLRRILPNYDMVQLPNWWTPERRAAHPIIIPPSILSPRANFTMVSIRTMIVGDAKVGKTCAMISYTTQAFPGEYIPETFETYEANVMVDGKPISLSLFDTQSWNDESIADLRSLSYPGQDVFIIAYSVTDYASYWSVFDRWAPEIRARTPANQAPIPIILAAFKSDLCADVPDYNDTPECTAAREALARGETRRYRHDPHITPAASDDVKKPAHRYGPLDNSAHMWPDSLVADGPVFYEHGVAMAHAIGAAGFVEVSALTQRGLRQLFDMTIRIGLDHRLALEKEKRRRPAKKCAVQ